MKSYIEAVAFSPITTGANAGNWKSLQTYHFYENDNFTGAKIIVETNDESNGADVPPPWTIFLISFAVCAFVSWIFGSLHFTTCLWIALSLALTTAWLLPRVHAEYIAAVFVHDVGLVSHRHLSRATIDRIFLRALIVTTKHTLDTSIGQGTWRLLRPYVLYLGVAAFGIAKEKFRYFKPESPVVSSE